MSLGNDLASIRKSLKLTLDDVQSLSKIPLDILTGIEDNSYITDKSHNKTYMRSFVRTYAKVLGITDKAIVDALDSFEAGIYSHNLLKKPEEKNPGFTLDTDALDEEEKSELNPPDIQTRIPEVPNTHSVDWAVYNKKISPTKKNNHVLGIMAPIFVVIILAVSGYFFRDELSHLFEQKEVVTEQTKDSEPSIILNENTIETPQLSGEMPNSNQENSKETFQKTNVFPVKPLLGDTLTLTVYAAFNNLDPVRITSDFTWHTNPYWIEKSFANNFDFKDTILVKGQYAKMLLLFNGHVIENPVDNYFNEAFNSIMLTRSVLSSEKYSQNSPSNWPEGVPLPDSVFYPNLY